MRQYLKFIISYKILNDLNLGMITVVVYWSGLLGILIAIPYLKRWPF